MLRPEEVRLTGVRRLDTDVAVGLAGALWRRVSTGGSV